MVVGYVVVAIADRFLGMRRHVTSAKVSAWLRLLVLILLLVSLLLLVSFLLADGVDGVREILLLAFLVLHVFLKLLPIWVDE